MHELFLQNLFVSALTFHGGANIIGYPWGSFNHANLNSNPIKSKEAPDFKAFSTIGAIMKSEAGKNI